MQFDCCGVEDNGYKMYFQNANATAGDDFPQSCCATGNLTCPKTVGQAERANPKVFKKTVRKCRTNVELNWLDYFVFIDTIWMLMILTIDFN